MAEGAGGSWAPAELSKAFAYATDWLGVYVDEVDALNVYPVPDGDTGTNMHLTMQSVRRQLQDAAPADMESVARALSYGSLLGARGNSGVILSQILKGFAESIKDAAAVESRALARALVAGATTAYGAVMKPVEGTILTVVRETANAAASLLGAPAVTVGPDADAREAAAAPSGEPAPGPLEVLEAALEAGESALARTPDLLPILKQAGVVDAGGKGLLRIFEGVAAYFRGAALPPRPKVTVRAQQQFDEEEFGFCTEFLLADVEVPPEQIRELVAPYGDSLLVVGAEGFVKGHIHTEEPEKLLATVARFGRMVRSKVEDMSEQHSEILAGIDAAAAESPKVAVVAVANGFGVTRAFRSLGVRVVGGGQTENPSVEDIADAVRSVGAHDVIVLPNNKNVVMAAERVGEIVNGKNVRVIPTKTMGEGLAAAVLFQDGADPVELVSEMTEAANASLTLEVTVANRTADVGGVHTEEGQAIGLADGELVRAGGTVEDVLVEMLAERGTEYDLATLFYSAATGPDAANETLARLGEVAPDLEIELHPGAPELYPYLLVLE